MIVRGARFEVTSLRSITTKTTCRLPRSRPCIVPRSTFSLNSSQFPRMIQSFSSHKIKGFYGACHFRRFAINSIQRRYFFNQPRSTTNKRDYYEVLDVSKDASAADIKRAYYKLAKQCHPDSNPGDKEAAKKFAEVSHAYEILADDKKRKAYDSYGHDAEQMEQGMPGGGFSNAEDMFRDLFGGGGGGGGQNPFEEMFGNMGGQSQTTSRRQPQRGSDLETSMHLDFMEAVEGCKKQINIRSQSECTICTGSGVKKGTEPVHCSTCDGRGVVTQSSGFFHVQTSCPSCGGEGQSIQKCGGCGGDGLNLQSRTVNVKIPAGVDNATRVRLASQGNAGAFGGSRGDLWLRLQVEKHNLFKREKTNVHLTIPIDVTTAILGGSISVPTLKNKNVSLKLSPGVQPGDTKVMRGKGIKQVNRDNYGNQYVHLKVEIPKELTSSQKELIEKFASENEQKN